MRIQSHLFRHSAFWPDICTAWGFPPIPFPPLIFSITKASQWILPVSYLHMAAACLWFCSFWNFRVNYIARGELLIRDFFPANRLVEVALCVPTVRVCYYSREIKRELSACLSAWVSILESKCVSQSVALLHGIGNVCFKFRGVKIGTVAWYWKPIRVCVCSLRRYGATEFLQETRI